MATSSTDAALVAVVAATAGRWLAADASALRQLEQPGQPRLHHLIFSLCVEWHPSSLYDQGSCCKAWRAQLVLTLTAWQQPPCSN